MNSFLYEVMQDRMEVLDRLDLRIQWGNYDIRVLRFHLATFLPGKVVSYHKHEEFEFHYIPRGMGKVIIGEREFPLERGMLYLTGPGVVHYQEADSNEAMYELCLHVDIKERTEGNIGITDQWEIAEAHECVSKIREMPLEPAEDVYQAMPCFLEAFQASLDNYIGSYTTIKQAVIQILLRTVRAYDTGKVQPSLPSRDMNAIRYRLAMKYIRANHNRPLTLEDVAEKLNISSRQLQRIFKSQPDQRSFSIIVEDVRLEAVCRRLEDSGLSVESIAALEGFASGNYLHSVFRKRLGMTPSEYRNQTSLRNGGQLPNE
ncbi:helix-turn-helix domain-containing protein [Paenibacillus sp. GCM10012307]|uniref:Helix-turn-helix transcriptional regulator n=1 Tax=Paenibacillus roseus TaxID=2798579 RepID=A0A934J6J6_9BACL|nr:helix-turn-helix domain-containing protein [Paenibacillus roseus]MBJ6362659.1 helix-turn-helix transcriptional regulator [Paenibacillus roseus]